MKESLFQDLLQSIKSLPTNVLKEMKANMEQEQMREEFEQWAVKERGYSVERFESEPCQYVEQNTHVAWVAWKASREHLVVVLPSTSGYSSYDADYYCSDVQWALEEQGIKYK